MSNPPAGSSEFLATLLTGPNNSCPHSDKTKSRHLPLRLGFSRHTDGGITDVDTSKLCQSCYDAAVPTGFDVWSTYYKAGVRPMDPAHKAHLNQTMISNQEWATYYGPNATRPPPTNTGWQAVPVPGKGDYYPPMSQAGLEDDHDAEVRSDIRMPVNAEAREAFRYIREGGQPFYIDQLHLTKPWDPNAPDQAAEDRRVARENVLAYQGARRGIVGTGVGGGGVNSIVEQRILGDRKEEIPGRFGSSGMLLREDDYSTPGPPSGGTTGAQEYPTTWPENYTMPSNDNINREERSMTGTVTGPTAAETERRYFLERRDDQSRVAEDPSYASGARSLAATQPPAQSSSSGCQDEYEMYGRW